MTMKTDCLHGEREPMTPVYLVAEFYFVLKISDFQNRVKSSLINSYDICDEFLAFIHVLKELNIIIQSFWL